MTARNTAKVFLLLTTVAALDPPGRVHAQAGDAAEGTAHATLEEVGAHARTADPGAAHVEGRWSPALLPGQEPKDGQNPAPHSLDDDRNRWRPAAGRVAMPWERPGMVVDEAAPAPSSAAVAQARNRAGVPWIISGSALAVGGAVIGKDVGTLMMVGGVGMTAYGLFIYF